jgi:hypothetical protein
MDFLQCLFKTSDSSKQTTPLLQADSLSPSSSSSVYLSSSSPSQQDKLLLPHECLCRARLALLSPKIHRAAQEKRLDEVFKVTGDIIKNAKSILDCTNCQVSWPDLICILSVFQQTNICWEHITKMDFFGSIKVSVGMYEVPLADNAELRRMLIVDLIKQATFLLESLHSLGQNLSLLQQEHGRLTQINLSYLQAVVENFKSVFQSVLSSVDAPRAESTGLYRGNRTR